METLAGAAPSGVSAAKTAPLPGGQRRPVLPVGRATRSPPGASPHAKRPHNRSQQPRKQGRHVSYEPARGSHGVLATISVCGAGQPYAELGSGVLHKGIDRRGGSLGATVATTGVPPWGPVGLCTLPPFLANQLFLGTLPPRGLSLSQDSCPPGAWRAQLRCVPPAPALLRLPAWPWRPAGVEPRPSSRARDHRLTGCSTLFSVSTVTGWGPAEYNCTPEPSVRRTSPCLT